MTLTITDQYDTMAECQSFDDNDEPIWDYKPETVKVSDENVVLILSTENEHDKIFDEEPIGQRNLKPEIKEYCLATFGYVPTNPEYEWNILIFEKAADPVVFVLRWLCE